MGQPNMHEDVWRTPAQPNSLPVSGTASDSELVMGFFKMSGKPKILIYRIEVVSIDTLGHNPQ